MNDIDLLPAIPVLESQRLKLRPITLNDAQALFNYAKNENITKYVPWKAHKSINDSIGFINSLLQEYKQLSSLMWAVQLKDDETNTMIGTCGFIRYFTHTKCLEIGYAFNPKEWGKGYAKEALLTAIKYGFENTNSIRIEGSCVKENIASAKTMESVGMKFEGISRSNFIKDGKVSDCKIFSIIRSEYFKK
ncbi:GNAT family N-acetyltransferase [Spiroplasma endosymbiont of Nomada rufipes]|uniref:GNAT family N-acetyltransferase n=1 Tax=Spiroplasma endosymbiont of Nomada rufipes TaxID=3077933 RepID=UPI00376F202E